MQAAVRILIADDHPDTRLILRDYFEAKGYAVCEAHNGEEAMACIRSARPDAVVLDIQMPRMDGIQVLREVRGDQDLRDLKILALSAHAFAEDVREISNAGADSYLAKPADPRVVIEAVRTLIEAR